MAAGILDFWAPIPMNTLAKRLIGLSALSLLSLSVAQAQRPVAAAKPWPNVGFQEVFDAATFFPSMAKANPPPAGNGEDGDMFTGLTNAGDGSGRIYLVERVGKIWTVENGKILSEPFLDLTSLTNYFPANSERGLLSLAFSPDYKNDHTFYVYYTSAASGNGPSATGGDLTIARYKVDPKDPYHALKDSGEVIWSLAHPQVNHNGGTIAFGKDGMLYLGTGDGGGGNDMTNNAQNLGILLGKMLRFDVKSPPDAGKKYHVPADNPFVNNPNAKPEIWALGVRNPFRFSFDTDNGDLYIGNVGQDQYEQVYYQPVTSKGGENYGWSIYEGTHELTAIGGGPVAGKPPQTPGTPTITYPVADFPHPPRTGGFRAPVQVGPNDFRCIIGGYVYRGAEFPNWDGVYFFSDWLTCEVWAMRKDADGKWETHEVDGGLGKDPAQGVVTFGTDEKGNLYLTSFGNGKIYKLVETP